MKRIILEEEFQCEYCNRKYKFKFDAESCEAACSIKNKCEHPEIKYYMGTAGEYDYSQTVIIKECLQCKVRHYKLFDFDNISEKVCQQLWNDSDYDIEEV